MSEYRLVMKGVVKTFPGVKALDHAQLELRPGKVMALMGENGAGKSTLMKCMFGIYKMDEGEIEYEGQKVTIPTPLDALDRGIAMVHQELQPIPARTVAENIWLGRYPTKKYGIVTVVDHAKMYKDTDELLKKLKLDIDPHAKLGSLSIAQMQMVEIAKAVSANCKVLILDEPTSSLTANEVESLFRIMRDLKEQGVALVCISASMVSVSSAPAKRSLGDLWPTMTGTDIHSSANYWYTWIIFSASSTASSRVACAVWPSCHRNSAVRRNRRVRISQRTTFAHWLHKIGRSRYD